jgi:hypothetical protein
MWLVHITVWKEVIRFVRYFIHLVFSPQIMGSLHQLSW